MGVPAAAPSGGRAYDSYLGGRPGTETDTAAVGPRASMNVMALYPGPPERVALEGLYMGDIPANGRSPFIYANFLMSLDGRIAMRNANGRKGVPEAIANDRDWRLYTELLVQADAVLTTAHHARAIASGEQQDMMAIAHKRYPDLRNYRRARGLSGHPTCVVVSSRLDFPGAELKAAHPGPVVTVSPKVADSCRVQSIRQAGVEIVTVDSPSHVTGHELLRVLAERELGRVYMIGGPRLFHSLLEDGVVQRLYLTIAARVLGGDRDIETLVRGPAFSVPAEAKLRRLVLDAETQPQQLFTSYDLSAR